MTLTNRFGKAGLRTMVIGLMAMGLAVGANTELNTSKAHASTSDTSLWIAERAVPYGSYVSPTTVVGADCSYTFNPYRRTVNVHAPVAQTGSVPAKLAWWVRLYNYETGAWYTDWFPQGTYTLPAYSSPLFLGGSVRFEGPGTSFTVRAQIYVRSYDVNTNAELGHAVLTVNYYSAAGSIMPSC